MQTFHISQKNFQNIGVGTSLDRKFYADHYIITTITWKWTQHKLSIKMFKWEKGKRWMKLSSIVFLSKNNF